MLKKPVGDLHRMLVMNSFMTYILHKIYARQMLPNC
nr:MAG TPA: hypothetical protein [Caudoviricetes sp.]